jgi:hypothetical protein
MINVIVTPLTEKNIVRGCAGSKGGFVVPTSIKSNESKFVPHYQSQNPIYFPPVRSSQLYDNSTLANRIVPTYGLSRLLDVFLPPHSQHSLIIGSEFDLSNVGLNAEAFFLALKDLPSKIYNYIYKYTLLFSAAAQS